MGQWKCSSAKEGQSQYRQSFCQANYPGNELVFFLEISRSHVLGFSRSHVLTFSLPYVLARQIFPLSASLFERREGYLFPFFGYVVYSNHVSVISWLFLHFLPVNSPLSNVIKTSLQCHPCLRPPPPPLAGVKQRDGSYWRIPLEGRYLTLSLFRTGDAIISVSIRSLCASEDILDKRTSIRTSKPSVLVMFMSRLPSNTHMLAALALF